MTKRTTLAEIFRAAGKAHHHVFAATNRDDPRCWPEWYAQDLEPTLSAVLNTELEQDTLCAEFRAADAEMRARAPSADWALYYADWFLTRRVA